MFVIRPYCNSDKNEIIALWGRCGLLHPNNNPEKDIERKMQVNPQWFLVGLLDGKLVASVMVGYEGHRGWINYLGVDPEYQKQGLGRAMMSQAEIILKAAGCPKINLQVRSTNSKVVDFYKSLGYVQDELISMSRRLVVDNPSDNCKCSDC